MHSTAGSGSGSGAPQPHANPTGGELHNNPFTSGATIR
jgi:hypothetical protein